VKSKREEGDYMWDFGYDDYLDGAIYSQHSKFDAENRRNALLIFGGQDTYDCDEESDCDEDEEYRW